MTCTSGTRSMVRIVWTRSTTGRWSSRISLLTNNNNSLQEALREELMAAHSDPHNMTYRLDLGARREAAIQQLISLADTARSAHQLDAAAQDYKRVLTIDPNNDRAKRGLASLAGDARHGDVIAQARKDFERKDYDAAEAKLRVVLNESPGYGPAQDLAAEITAARGPITVAPRLKTRDNHK